MPQVNIKKIAKALGAEHLGKIAIKGGYFGAMAISSWFVKYRKFKKKLRNLLND